jgi:hypothetical protein
MRTLRIMTTGTISKSLNKIPEQHNWKAGHQGTMEIAILGTAHILW